MEITKQGKQQYGDKFDLNYESGRLPFENALRGGPVDVYIVFLLIFF